MAIDPEDDPVTYFIVSGNDLRQFAIGSRSGIITVIRKLDREDLTKYRLIIKAEDTGKLASTATIIKAEDTGKLASTATVNIKVTDINDKNPEFVGDPYNFTVREGLNKTFVGKVHATDADEGVNALVTYMIPTDLPFNIDNETGEVTTKKALDYESQKMYQFVVTAKDGALDPRIATATVTVNVLDIEDEVPVFTREEYEASVPENVPDYFVTDVMAIDPDTVKKITYVIHQGPTDLFRIDENSGAIYTTRGLDYEKDSEHTLIIGTLENMSDTKGSTTKVVVKVEDRNDIPPVFTKIPPPIMLKDDTPIGTSVYDLETTDSDGTAPGNKVRYEIIGRGKATKYFQIDPDTGKLKVTVRYEIIGRGKATKYFQIDPDTGKLKVTNDLKKEVDTEYQIDVRAYDLGEPQLSSVITLDIYIQHVATVPPEVSLRFADNSYSVQVPENSTIGTLVKSLTIVNSRTHGDSIPLRCQITSGNTEGKFLVNVTEERNCALYLNDTVDYEEVESYKIEVDLVSVQAFLNKKFSRTQVSINVVDINDNKPFFIKSNNIQDKFYAAIPNTAALATTVIQIKADDKDSGKYGKVQYILQGNQSETYFAIDPTSGIVRTKRSVEEVDNTQPFRFTVVARDNPNATIDYNSIEAPLIINLINRVNRLILAIGDAKPDDVASKVDVVAQIIQEQSGLIIGVEKLNVREFVGENGTLEVDPAGTDIWFYVEKLNVREFVGENGTLEVDPAGTDIWFYVVDPETDTILPVNHTLVQKLILDKSAMTNITFDVSGQIKQTAFNIHEPLVTPKIKTASIATLNGEVFPYALIIIACIIFILGIVGIIYICVSWSRYKSFKDQMQRQYVVPASPARYDSVYVEPNLKEYETQVLQMCVPVDDPDDYNDLHLDFSNKNHTFSLENVSYITKDNNITKYGQQSPVSSESATTARASSVGEHILTNNMGHPLSRDHMYQRSSDDEEMNASPTNENVMFREKKDYSHIGFTYGDHSPVETTTEL
ncbi:Cadherin domain [Popillia japonica]|uniref:Cadherin domain n=1 Tax=Popillia japonica TaxID=7064 RepID=A0AAW1LKI7_POPJA